MSRGNHRRGAAPYVAASALLATVLALTSFSGCCACSTSCDPACDAKSQYCSVMYGYDGDGAHVYANCTALPAACAASPTCECLQKVQSAEDMKYNPTPSSFHCTGSPATGLTLSDCGTDTSCPPPGY